MQDSTGRNHHPYGYVTAFLGATITPAERGIYGAIGADGRATSAATPSENRIAALLALGIWPFAPEAFAVSDVPGAASEEAAVRLGHRPASQPEVDAYAALYADVADAVAHARSTDDPRTVVARALLTRPEKNARWTAHFMDALRVSRIDDQALARCWGERRVTAIDPQLATFVRDNLASATQAQTFSMLDLARSAIALDDPTVMYRAHLFALVSRPIVAANVPDVEAELARREDFGNTFDAAYLNRDLVCLGCHNSESSITDSDDPALDRHWPLAGQVDRAVFGASTGGDAGAAHAMFRVDGFLADRGGRRPWGLGDECGEFTSPAGLAPDPAGIAGRFGSLRGDKLTVYDLEGALKRGFDTLRGQALVVGADGAIADPDAALAYLVATGIVESVWREAVGTPLTIANYFPRNQAARDTLQRLTDHFVATGFSLDALLVDVVTSDYFSRRPPEDGCGAGPYSYPAVLDPWVIADRDPERHGNGPGDAVAPVSGRTLLSAAYRALDWTPPAEEQFPSNEEGCEQLACEELDQYCEFLGACCDTYAVVCEGRPPVNDPEELPFLRAVGVFLKSGDRGFRGLDFQARLAWEDRFGICAKPTRITGDDFIDRAVAAGHSTGAARVSDVVVLIKDRLIGEPQLEPLIEGPALEAVLGQPLSAPATALTTAGARRLCGVLLSSPQFVLQGLAGRGGAPPKLTLPDDGFEPACARLAAAPPRDWTIACASGSLTASPVATP